MAAERVVAVRTGVREIIQTRSDAVYRRLREEIVKGLIRPNERLVETELALRLGVSRTPVRESLKRLADDGLVCGPRHHLVAREHTPHEIRDIFETRAALEGFGARLAAERATEAELEAICAYVASVRPLDVAPQEYLVKGNSNFHDAIARAAHNSRLLDAVRRNRELYFGYRYAAQYTPEQALASISEHAAIVLALRRRDPDAAEAAMRTHCFEALRLMLEKRGAERP